jgi:hypothetical protein
VGYLTYDLGYLTYDLGYLTYDLGYLTYDHPPGSTSATDEKARHPLPSLVIGPHIRPISPPAERPGGQSLR